MQRISIVSKMNNKEKIYMRGILSLFFFLGEFDI